MNVNQVPAQPALSQRMSSFKGLEIRYERSFLLDLTSLETAAQKRMQQFVFKDFTSIQQVHSLPGFRALGSSKIFYRFTLDHYLVSLEITGQVVKFLRLLPKPEP
ncbi:MULTISPECIES: cytotoxic translational repressor of toxin-antitoxin stability system [Cyanophyceae]|uniref:Cytotoxic translational repressor of toxin-antitoxin stability system n=1 Tax=Stenomitos frigidus AS-A4 TaxID=2933935 RepID=A0ABV0KKZ8_9CYAN|nr:cytotoxic translational repressor of toxin-antitoxin stability system [Phormidium sp. FACHB-592]